MSNFAFVSALLRGDWAIEEQFALHSLELVDRILAGTFTSPHVDVAAPQMAEGRDHRSGKRKPDGQQVMIIPIEGPLMKNDGPCGQMGMATMGAYIKQANSLSEVAGIVLCIDSPGGTVDGTEALARIVKSSQKPVVAYIDGMAASAALWIGSAARKIIASSENDQVGSVGVMMNMVVKDGEKIHTVISDQTPDKNKYSLEVLEGKYDNVKKDRLNPLAQNFIDAVKANREGVEESFLTGKMYFAKNAMGNLVDRIGSMEDAINAVMELAAEGTSQSQVISMNQFAKINAVLAVESLESVDGNINLNEEQLAAIETALGETGGDTAAVQEQLESVEASLTETQSALDTATTDLTTAQARILELEAQVTELEQEPGADTATVVKSTDGDGSSNMMGISADSQKLYILIRS